MRKEDKHDEFALLLSAYLDGEVTGMQRQKVERRLNRDPDAQLLLDELREVRERLGELPKERAPASLVGRVHEELERDVLIGDDMLGDAVGKKLLAVRHFAAAAAVIALAGGIALFVYYVLLEPGQVPTGPKPDGGEPIVALADKPSDAVRKAAGVMDGKGPRPDGMPVAADMSEGRGLGTEGRVVSQASGLGVPAYSSMRIVIDSSRPGSDAWEVDYTLAQNSIGPIVRSRVAGGGRHYAFVCSTEQFRAVFREVSRKMPDGIALAVVDPMTDAEVLIAAATESQAMMLAREADHSRQLAHVLRFSHVGQVAGVRGDDGRGFAVTADGRGVATRSIRGMNSGARKDAVRIIDAVEPTVGAAANVRAGGDAQAAVDEEGAKEKVAVGGGVRLEGDVEERGVFAGRASAHRGVLADERAGEVSGGTGVREHTGPMSEAVASRGVSTGAEGVVGTGDGVSNVADSRLGAAGVRVGDEVRAGATVVREIAVGREVLAEGDPEVRGLRVLAELDPNASCPECPSDVLAANVGSGGRPGLVRRPGSDPCGVVAGFTGLPAGAIAAEAVPGDADAKGGVGVSRGRGRAVVPRWVAVELILRCSSADVGEAVESTDSGDQLP